MLKKNYFKTPVLSLLILFLFGLTSMACSHYNDLGYGDLQVLQEKAFNTSPGKNFILKASSGDVMISTSDSPDVYIKILGNERARKKVDFHFDNSSNGVTVEADVRSGWNFFSFGSGIKLRFEIQIPKNYNADVSSRGGDIRLSDLNGEIVLRSSGGDIIVK